MHDKQHLRSAIAARRAARPPADLADARRALSDLAPALSGRAGLLAAFVGIGTEPPTDALVDRLVSLGSRVLLPIVEGSDLDWAAYDGQGTLVRSTLGVLEPTGPRRGQTAVADCGLVLVPALAVDRRGHRLGRGRGYYDRALGGIPRDRIFAVIYDDELVDEVPVESHDVPVGGAVTPSGVLTF